MPPNLQTADYGAPNVVENTLTQPVAKPLEMPDYYYGENEVEEVPQQHQDEDVFGRYFL